MVFCIFILYLLRLSMSLLTDEIRNSFGPLDEKCTTNYCNYGWNVAAFEFATVIYVVRWYVFVQRQLQKTIWMKILWFQSNEMLQIMWHALKCRRWINNFYDLTGNTFEVSSRQVHWFLYFICFMFSLPFAIENTKITTVCTSCGRHLCTKFDYSNTTKMLYQVINYGNHEQHSPTAASAPPPLSHVCLILQRSTGQKKNDKREREGRYIDERVKWAKTLICLDGLSFDSNSDIRFSTWSTVPCRVRHTLVPMIIWCVCTLYMRWNSTTATSNTDEEEEKQHESILTRSLLQVEQFSRVFGTWIRIWVYLFGCCRRSRCSLSFFVAGRQACWYWKEFSMHLFCIGFWCSDFSRDLSIYRFISC